MVLFRRLLTTNFFTFLFLIQGLMVGTALAQSRITQWMTVDEFKDLGIELSQKVNLFKDVWSVDPDAEFIGGTSRDYFYWLKGKLSQARTKRELDQIVNKLRRQEIIDVREFIIGESDVDIASQYSLHSINPDHYGVKKIDPIGLERFDPLSSRGKDEINQGYIPIEKIRLKHGQAPSWNGMGDGIAEIYQGRPTIFFAPAESFESTEFAKKKINHPILLAFRYIRLLAINYFYENGKGYPKKSFLFDIDSSSESTVRQTISEALNGSTLIPYLKNDRFVVWINQTIQKAFRSYTNPTAAKMLMKHFGAERIAAIYSQIQPFNRYLFARHRDPEVISQNLEHFGVNTSLFFEPPSTAFPDGFLYHGTKTESSFRSILFQGILPSTSGTAGDGLYGVSQKDLSFAAKRGGNITRVVKCRINKDAKIVDITKGEGRRIYKAFGKSETKFAEYFGVDIIRYPYGNTDAYVVKNAAAIKDARGYRRDLKTVSEMIEIAKTSQEDHFLEFLSLLFFSRFRDDEILIVLEYAPDSAIKRQFIESLKSGQSFSSYLRKTITELDYDSIELDVIQQLRHAVGFMNLNYQLEKSIVINAIQYKKVTNANEFLDLFSPARTSADLSNYNAMLRNILAENIELFWSFDPNIKQIAELVNLDILRRSDSADFFIAAWPRMKEKVTCAEEIASALKISIKGVKIEKSQEIVEILFEALNMFFSMEPTPELITSVLRNLELKSGAYLNVIQIILKSYTFTSINQAIKTLFPKGQAFPQSVTKGIVKLIIDNLNELPIQLEGSEDIRLFTWILEEVFQVAASKREVIFAKLKKALRSHLDHPDQEVRRQRMLIFTEFFRLGEFSQGSRIDKSVLNSFHQFKIEILKEFNLMDISPEGLITLLTSSVKQSHEIEVLKLILQEYPFSSSDSFLLIAKHRREKEGPWLQNKKEKALISAADNFLKTEPTEDQMREFAALTSNPEKVMAELLKTKSRLALTQTSSFQELIELVTSMRQRLTPEEYSILASLIFTKEIAELIIQKSPTLNQFATLLKLHEFRVNSLTLFVNYFLRQNLNKQDLKKLLQLIIKGKKLRSVIYSRYFEDHVSDRDTFFELFHLLPPIDSHGQARGPYRYSFIRS